ncbi:MAG: hypothetical protein Q9184_005261 [Pyrenodesmia sp. 2 TL-2023]
MASIRHTKEQEVFGLQAEVGELKTALYQVQQELKMAQVTSTWYRQGASEKQSRLEGLETAYDKLANEKRVQAQSIAKLQRELEETQKARDGFRVEIENHANSLEQVREELRTITESRDSFIVDKDSLTRDLQNAQQELEAVKEARASLEIEKTTSVTSLQHIQRQLNDALQELELVKNARDEFKATSETHVKTLEQVQEELRISLNQAQQARDRYEEEKQTELDEARDARDLFQAAKEAQDTVLESRGTELQKTREEAYALSAQNHTLWREKHDAQARLRTLEVTVNRHVHEKDSARNELSVTVFRADHAEKSLKAASEHIEKLHNSLDAEAIENDQLLQQLENLRLEKTEAEQALQLKIVSCKVLLTDRVEALMGVRLEDATLERMIACQTRATSQRLLGCVTGTHLQRKLPRMLFVADISPLGPVTHAINFWVSVSTGNFSFGDSQALFNADIIDLEASGAYQWVLDALNMGIDSMRSWPADSASVKKILTLLHGIAYVCYLLFGLEQPFDDARALRDMIMAALRDKKLLGASITGTVFDSVSSFVNGHQISSWIRSATLNPEAPEHLGNSNSDLGPGRFLIADHSTRTFTLTDEMDTDEALYAFDVNDVNSVQTSSLQSVFVRFNEGHVSRLPVSSLLLDSSFPFKESVSQWVLTFLSDKF